MVRSTVGLLVISADMAHCRLRLQERSLLDMRETDSRYDWLCYELEMTRLHP